MNKLFAAAFALSLASIVTAGMSPRPAAATPTPASASASVEAPQFGGCRWNCWPGGGWFKTEAACLAACSGNCDVIC